MKFIHSFSTLAFLVLASKVAIACPQTATSATSCDACQAAAAIVVPAAPVVTQVSPVLAQPLPAVAVQSYSVPSVAALAAPTVIAPAAVLAAPTVVTPNVVVNTVVHQPRKSARVQITRTRLRSR
jgi:hypothetical protein